MDIYKIFNELKIKYEEITHEAIYTIEEAQNIFDKIEGIGVKNLFLTDHKGHYYLVVLEENKRADIKEIASLVEKNNLSFGSEDRLYEILKLKQGSVTPLGIINDHNKSVAIIIDKDLINHKLLIHPNINTKTLSIEYQDLIKFIEYVGNKYIILN